VSKTSWNDMGISTLRQHGFYFKKCLIDFKLIRCWQTTCINNMFSILGTLVSTHVNNNLNVCVFCIGYTSRFNTVEQQLEWMYYLYWDDKTCMDVFSILRQQARHKLVFICVLCRNDMFNKIASNLESTLIIHGVYIEGSIFRLQLSWIEIE